MARSKLAILAATLVLHACTRSGPPFSPKEALKTIQIEKGFKIELFASEPGVSSPVAMDIDERGRIYVVEMPGYPLDTRPIGRIKLLEDTNGDGRPDRVTIFADGLVLPTSVMRWKKGILVTAAPNVWYFEDTDGDGRADVRRVVLTGFAFTNPQHTVNNPVYGLDNGIYLAHQGPARAVIYKDLFGDMGSDIRFPDRSDIPALKVTNRSVRFRPDTYQLEARSGGSQFGHTFDEWGHYFTVDNENHGEHEVIAARYLNRNPDLLAPTAMQDLSDHANAAKVYPITHHPRMKLLSGSGSMTSACSITRYLGGAFGSEFERVSFVAEPVYNLVHRDVWTDAGSTFVMKRAQEGVEFLASTDPWFTPVNFYIGPEGALYLVDYYREVIEHPEWLSTKDQNSKGLYRGQDRGRIYRIVPDATPALAMPKNMRLDEASDPDLVQQLANPNIWWRRTAQRLLVDRQSAQAVEPLVRLFSESPSALGRLHALWTLEGLGKLDTALIERALGDSESGVRENAIRLAESRLATAPALVNKLLTMGGDPDPKVRFQLVASLGAVDSPQVREVQSRVLARDIEDPWTQLAALSASSDRAPQFFAMATSPGTGFTSSESPGRAAFFRQVCSVIAARQKRPEIQRVLASAAAASRANSAWWVAASLQGLAAGVRGRPGAAIALKSDQDVLLKLFDSSVAPVRRASLELLGAVPLTPNAAVARLVRKSEATAAGNAADPEARADAVGFLAIAAKESEVALFKRLVDPQVPEQVQVAAVRGLGRIKGEESGRFLIENWRSMTAPARSEAANALVREPGRARLLLAALQNDQIQTWTLNFSQKERLMMHEDPEMRKTARALLEEPESEREKVVNRYQAALDMQGDPAQGEQVFKTSCAKCHKLNGVGADVGPDLGTVRDRPASLILTDILIPSKSIAPKHETYVVERVSGGIEEGVMGAQTPTTITLRREEGKETVISRGDIKRMYVSNLSAMPADLEKQIDVKQMASLLRFLKTAR